MSACCVPCLYRPLYRLDYVYLRAAPPDAPRPAVLRARSHRTIAADTSDHLAVVVDLELVEPADAA